MDFHKSIQNSRLRFWCFVTLWLSVALLALGWLVLLAPFIAHFFGTLVDPFFS